MVKQGKFIMIVLFSVFIIQPSESAFATNHSIDQPVRGIYVTAANTNGPGFQQSLSLVNQSDLNAMVVDSKDGEGRLIFTPAECSPYYPIFHPFISSPKEMVYTLKKNNIFPIARIVTFKDRLLAASRVSAIIEFVAWKRNL